MKKRMERDLDEAKRPFGNRKSGRDERAWDYEPPEIGRAFVLQGAEKGEVIETK